MRNAPLFVIESSKSGLGTLIVDESDIDIAVILNELTMQDLKKYQAIISQMPYKERFAKIVESVVNINNP